MNLIPPDTSSDAAIECTNEYVKVKFHDQENDEVVSNYTNQAVIDVVEAVTNAIFRYCGEGRTWNSFMELTGRTRRDVECTRREEKDC